MNPEVTILMPVYNAEKYLAKAIQSILDQTFTNFQFLIINDGSTDNSDQMINSFTDERINYVKYKDNTGLVAALNHGLKIASGKYIARMDADDIAVNTRIEKQVSVLNERSDIDLVGCHLSLIGADDAPFGELLYSTYHARIKVDSLFFCPVPHPGVMFRKDSFVSNGLFYKAEYKHVEDYDLWQRALKLLKFANYNEKLLNYRITEEQVSMVHATEQQWRADEIRQRYFLELNPSYSAEDIGILTSFFNKTIQIKNTVLLKKLLDLLNDLTEKNSALAIFDDLILRTCIGKRSDVLVRFYTSRQNKLYSIYRQTAAFKFTDKTPRYKMILLLKEWLA